MKQELKLAHERIAMLANRVTMRYENHNEDVDIAKKWESIAPSVESIECALNGKDCTVLNVSFSEGGFIDKHTHDRQEHIFVVSGSLTVNMYSHPEADPEVYQVQEGNRFIIPKYTIHSVRSNYAKLTVVFRPAFPVVEVTSSQS